MKLTTTIARSLELPPGKKDRFEWDDEFSGFGVRVRAGKKQIKRTWIYQYDIAGRTRRITIGNVIAIGIESARKTAGQLQGEVRRGNDPAAEKNQKLERAALVFANVMKSFLEVKEKTARRTETYLRLRRYLGGPSKSLHPMSLSAITRGDIASVLTPIVAQGEKHTHNHLLSTLSIFFNWAITQGLIEHSPVFGIKKLETKSRERVLSMAELAAVSQALRDLLDYANYRRLALRAGERKYDNAMPWYEQGIIASMTDYHDIVHLLMFTACRRSEISELLWCEVRQDKTFIDEGLPIEGPAIVLPSERAKNQRRFIVPLSKPAQTILFSRQRDLDGGLVFAKRNFSVQKKLLDAALAERGHKFEPWVLHDLRRSVATHMGEMGILPHVIEVALNHVSGARKGVAGVYNKSKLEQPKRQALEAWGEHLQSHIEGRAPSGTVVPFRA
jgi:integrase